MTVRPWPYLITVLCCVAVGYERKTVLHARSQRDVRCSDEIPDYANETVNLIGGTEDDIRRLDPSVLALNVTQSNFSILGRGSFEKLQSLVVLHFRRNGLRNLSDGAFSGLTALELLDLGDNELSYLPSDAFVNTTRIKVIILEDNRFKTWDSVVPALSLLPQLQKLVLNGNKLQGELGREHLRPLENSSITHLELNYCEIGNYVIGNNISNDTLHGFYKLRCLSVEGNRLNNNGLKNLLSGQANSTSFSRLSAGNIRTGHPPNRFDKLSKRTLPFLPNLKWLDVTSSDIAAIDKSLFESIPNVEVLILRSNKLTKIPEALKGTKVVHLDLSANLYNGQSFTLDSMEDHDLVALETLEISENKIDEVRANSFGNLPSLRILNMTQDRIRKVQPFAFSSLTNLQVLELSFNNMQEIVNNTFDGLKSLTDLYLDNNNLKIFPHNHFFRNLFNLTYISFRYNSLCDMWPWMLVDQANLEILDFSNNKIESWDIEALTTTPNLRYLYLQVNAMKRMTPTMYKEISALDHADLSQNPFDCSDCYIDIAQRWLSNQTSKGNYTCLDITNSEIDGTSILEAVQPASCREGNRFKFYLIVSVTSSTALLFLVVSALLAYRFRYYAKYYFYIWCQCYASRFNKENNSFKYDIYMSYTDNDKQWLHSTLLPSLEGRFNFLKCYVRDRDGELGRHIIDIILDGMEESRFFVALVSDQYTQSNWRMWEMKLAMCKAIRECRANVIIINVDGTAEAGLSRSIRTAINTQVYLKWSSDSLKQRAVFEKLCDKLNERLRCSA